jgi:hypothetical protein
MQQRPQQLFYHQESAAATTSQAGVLRESFLDAGVLEPPAFV